MHSRPSGAIFRDLSRAAAMGSAPEWKPLTYFSWRMARDRAIKRDCAVNMVKYRLYVRLSRIILAGNLDSCASLEASESESAECNISSSESWLRTAAREVELPILLRVAHSSRSWIKSASTFLALAATRKIIDKLSTPPVLLPPPPPTRTHTMHTAPCSPSKSKDSKPIVSAAAGGEKTDRTEHWF
jgi:hypothetical protein